jgi:hypothetical protein
MFFCVFCTNCCLAQTYRREELNLELLVEELFASQEADESYEDIYETLLQHLMHPIQLNKAKPEELKSLYILTPAQLNSFFAYKAAFGDFISIYELQAIPHFDLQTIYKLLPFIRIDEALIRQGNLLDRIVKSKDAYLMLRNSRVWEMRRGFTAPDTLSNGNLSSRYLGDPNGIFTRFRISQAKDFSLGFTAEKDPGEQLIWNPNGKQYGADFISYHFTVYNRGKWNTISVGDYQLQTGQGLVFGSGFSVGKGAETITTIRRSHLGLRPYTAAMEFNFFRGAAASYQLRNVQVTVMASQTPRDANLQVQQDSLERELAVLTSLPSSGLHRTPTELARRHAANETNLGGNLHYASKQKVLQLGINYLQTRFSQSFERTPRVYNQFEFSGQENQLGSVYWNFNFQNHFLFGESAISQNGGQGHVIGLMSSLHPKLGFSLLWRNYARDFHSFYGNAFAESTRPINERGLYMGMNFKPSSKWAVSIYHDSFEFPWLRFRMYIPSSGTEWLARIAYSPSRNKLLFFQLREETKDRNINTETANQATYQVAAGRKTNFVANLDMAIDKKWSMKSRVMASSYRLSNSNTSGFAISQDLNYDQGTWRFSSRIILFDTEDYENRQYLFERNVLWYFSIPPMHGQGMRYYILTQYRVSNKLTIWGRFARTSYTDRDVIGSGLQRINGNTQTETVLQLRYQINR